MNRLPAAKDRKRERGRERGAQEGGAEEEVNEYTRPLFSLLLKWRGEQKPAAIGKGGRTETVEEERSE